MFGLFMAQFMRCVYSKSAIAPGNNGGGYYRGPTQILYCDEIADDSEHNEMQRYGEIGEPAIIDVRFKLRNNLLWRVGFVGAY